MPSMCSLIENTGVDPPLATPVWDSATGEKCCLRVAVYRFPPYVDFAGGSMFPDWKAPVYNLCGAVIGSLQILTASVNCTCMRVYRAPDNYGQDDEDGIKFYRAFDTRVAAVMSYSDPDVISHQADHYPLGSITATSIMGAEHPTPGRGIAILALFQPYVWLCFWLSVSTLTLLMTLIACQTKSRSHPCVQTCAHFLYIMGVCLSICFSWTSLNEPSRLVQLKNLVIGIWSLLSAFLLTEAATADLLELLMYQPGTNRFTSLANMIQRATDDICVMAFDRSPLSEAIEENQSLVPHYRIFETTKAFTDDIMNVLNQIATSRAVLVGVFATSTYIKATAVKELGFKNYRDVFYVQKDTSHSMPYYIKTTRHWPLVKLAQWRRASAALLESGLSEFFYERSLAESIPDVLRQEAKERDERAQILTTDVIKLKSIWTILFLCLFVVYISVIFILIETTVHFAIT